MQILSSVYFILISFVISTELYSVAGINCYQCGAEATSTDGPVDSRTMKAIRDQESCKSFETAFSWSGFAIRCGENQICSKIITAGPEGPRTVRGCAERNSSIGQIHQLRCGIMVSQRMGPSESDFADGDKDEICFCDSNHCNLTVLMKPNSIYVILEICTLYLIYFVR